MMLLVLFQNVIPAEVSLVCVVKPDEFWDKKVTHFCFWKEKDRLGFEVSRSACSNWTGSNQPEFSILKENDVRLLWKLLLSSGNLKSLCGVWSPFPLWELNL